ncbi:MAG: cell wall hydrolase [Halanaerobium sp.]
MIEFITFMVIVALAYAGVKLVGEKDKKEDRKDYKDIDLDDYKDYDPPIPDFDVDKPDDDDKILSSKEVFELADIEIYARTIYGEGRNLNDDEIIKIAWVIRNRVNDSGYPDQYADVCLQKYQFSCWNSLYTGEFKDQNQREVRKKVLADQTNYYRCFDTAQKVYNSNKEDNPLPGVKHYVLNDDTVKVEGDKIVESNYPDWVEKKKIIQNDGKGSHIFLA